MNVAERISAFRSLMREKGIDAYVAGVKEAVLAVYR